MIQRRQPLTPDAALGAARWLLDAGAEIPGDLLLDAADAANLASGPTLGAELARRAVDAGAGMRGVRLLARAHTIRNQFAEAEAVLAAAEPLARGDPQALDYVGQRLHLLAWVLRRTDAARALLEHVDGWSSDPGWEQQLANLEGRPRSASPRGSAIDCSRLATRCASRTSIPSLCVCMNSSWACRC